MCRANNRGFTLLEMMATLAIVAVMSTIVIRANLPNRQQQFTAVAHGLLSGLTAARSNALSTGKRSYVSIEGGAIVAFVDADGDRLYSSGDTLLFRYPAASGAALPQGFSLTSATLQEKGSGPQTAAFDGRGFYIDSFNGYSSHDANFCLRDAQTDQASNILLSRFGWSGITDTACGDQPPCPFSP